MTAGMFTSRLAVMIFKEQDGDKVSVHSAIIGIAKGVSWGITETKMASPTIKQSTGHLLLSTTLGAASSDWITGQPVSLNMSPHSLSFPSPSVTFSFFPSHLSFKN